MGNSPSNKTNRSFESYFSIAFERLAAFQSHPNPTTNCFRLFHGFDESFPPEIKGLTIDLYYPVILIQTSQQTESNAELLSFLQNKFPINLPIILKYRFYEDGKFLNKTTVLNGSVASDPFLVKENERRFSVQLTEKLDTGLYLDTANVREWLFKNSSQKKILNLYSYTCSYGVAAMLGGAFDVIHVDSSRSALQTGKNNYEANSLVVNPRSFSHLLVADYLRFARKKKDSFDIIIIDPSPPPLVMRLVEEKIAYYLGPIQKCIPCLKPNGYLLVSCHSFVDISPELFQDVIMKNCESLATHESINFPEYFSVAHPKMFVFQIKSEFCA